MFASMMTPVCEPHYELRFNRRLGNERGYAFACDAKGHVDMTTLTARALNNYLFARAVSGNQLFPPTVALVF
jgi:hypothetical protein